MARSQHEPTIRFAPGSPGIPPRWTSSAKSGVGTALRPTSRVWFTISHGILNEVYYPRLDRACIRDLGIIVTDGIDFFSEEKRDTAAVVTPLDAGVPAFHLVNTSRSGHYRIDKHVIADPRRDAVLQLVRFTALRPSTGDYHVYVLLAPHLSNHGWGNTAWIDDYKGVPMLMAARDGTALAVACAPEWMRRSAGFVGFSDGWQQLTADKQLRACQVTTDLSGIRVAG